MAGKVLEVPINCCYREQGHRAFHAAEQRTERRTRLSGRGREIMCLVSAQDRKTPEIGIEGECGAGTLKTRERDVRGESRLCRRIGGIKGRKKSCCCS